MDTEAGRFDFLEGEWDAVTHSAGGDGAWQEGRGRLTVTRILDGCAFLEFFEGPYCSRQIKAVGLRAYNPHTRLWEHTWTDTDSQGGFPVWRGGFVDGAIVLRSEWQEGGRTVISRLTWSRIEADRAHWESHRSADGGATWAQHWTIDFTRRKR
jgi:hypothetical protein